MKKIPLTQGQVTLVDDADFVWLSKWKWNAIFHKNTQSFYAVRGVYTPEKVVRIFMARLILGLTDSKVFADHRNGKTLDNQRLNLRAATPTQNAVNAKLRKDNKTGFKGVTLDKTGKWKAQIGTQGQDRYLGLFSTPEEAFVAYTKKAVELHKEFVRLDNIQIVGE